MFSPCWSLPGYLSSPHVGHKPLPSPRGAQHGPVISNPVIPAAVSGIPYYTSIYCTSTILRTDTGRWWAVCRPVTAALPRNQEGSTAECPSAGQCSRLPSSCVYCHYHHNCTYGHKTAFTCKPKRGVHCLVSLQLMEPGWTQCDPTLWDRMRWSITWFRVQKYNIENNKTARYICTAKNARYHE